MLIWDGTVWPFASYNEWLVDRQGNAKTPRFQRHTDPANVLLSEEQLWLAVLPHTGRHICMHVTASTLQTVTTRCRAFSQDVSYGRGVSRTSPTTPIRKHLPRCVLSSEPSPGLTSAAAAPSILLGPQQWQRSCLDRLARKQQQTQQLGQWHSHNLS